MLIYSLAQTLNPFGCAAIVIGGVFEIVLGFACLEYCEIEVQNCQN